MDITEATPNSGVSWADLNLNTLDTSANTSTERTELPAGNYKFKLVGSKPNPFRAGDTDIDLVVVEGPQTKRHLFASLPTPDKGRWVAQAAAILIKRLGVEQIPGEDLVDTLSRAAANGTSAITADVVTENFTRRDGTAGSKPKLQFFSIAAAV